MPKPSFFQRLTGSVPHDDYEDDAQDEAHNHDQHYQGYEDESSGSELKIDVYQLADAIIVRGFIPGVPSTNVELSLTRDMLTINARREEAKEATDDAYFTRELDWTPLTRTVLLPSEVDIDLAEASENHGVLTIRMPKINKDREAKVKVRSR
jgi:HSP20 family protein